MVWPGYDEEPPVVLSSRRPGRGRHRLSSDYHRPPPVYYSYPTQDGPLVVPAGGPPHHLIVPAGGLPHHQRSSSVSGDRQAQIIINNPHTWEEHPGGRRPRSVHYHDGYYDRADRERSRSRHREYHSRTPSPHFEDPETKKIRDRLQEFEKKEEEEKHANQIKERLAIEQVKKEKEEAEKAKQNKELKEKAIEDYKADMIKKEKKEKEEKERIVEEYKAELKIKEEKAKKEKEEEEKKFDERMRNTLRQNNYSEAQIERMLKKNEKGENVIAEGSGLIHLNRPTYIRVRRKHLDPVTLDKWGLPWEWDESDAKYIIIKQWIPERQQEILFEHTRKLRETRQLDYASTEFKKERDQLLLVKKKETRKKSPARNWLLT